MDSEQTLENQLRKAVRWAEELRIAIDDRGETELIERFLRRLDTICDLERRLRHQGADAAGIVESEMREAAA